MPAFAAQSGPRITPKGGVSFYANGYNATYLELALRLKLPLATGDKSLRTAARSAGVDLLPA